jgi:hypothetical protein
MLVITILVHISSSNFFSATKNGLVSVWDAPIAMNSSTVDVDTLAAMRDMYRSVRCQKTLAMMIVAEVSA